MLGRGGGRKGTMQIQAYTVDVAYVLVKSIKSESKQRRYL